MRKFGFSFITALLAAEFFLFPQTVTESIPIEIKFAVLSVTLVLILSLQILDRNYVKFQEAAATRCRVLERILNLELSEIISQRYRQNRVDDYVSFVYGAFIAAILILGGFVLYPSIIFFPALILICIVAFFVAKCKIYGSIKVEYPNGPIDYTLDRIRCKQRERGAIKLTNLSELVLKIEANTIVWQIKKQDGAFVKTKKTDKDVWIRENGNYIWFWKVDRDYRNKAIEEDVYEVYRPKATLISELASKTTESGKEEQGMCNIIKSESGKTKLIPLKRKIWVYEKPQKATAIPEKLAH